MNSLGRSISVSSRTRGFKLVAAVTAALLVPIVGALPKAGALPGDPTVSVADASVVEGSTNGFIHFTIALSATAPRVMQINYATADLASGPNRAKSVATANANDKADYEAKTGSVTFAIGEQFKDVAVQVDGDTTPEPNEKFLLNISSPDPVPPAFTDAQGQGTIQNDDGTPATLSIANNVQDEGGAGTTATFGGQVITLSKVLTQPVTVTFATANGSATTADNDYVAKTATAVIPAGQTKADAPVTVNGDAKVEGDETFSINLSNPDNATIAVGASTETIHNDDGMPTVNVAPPGDVSESAGPKAITVSLNKASTATIVVDYTTQNGTATAPGDYTATSGTLTFAANETSKTVNVPITNDSTQEADESFSLVLSNPTNATIGTGTGTVKIVDDEAKPTVSIADKFVAEGTGGTTKLLFTVSLSAASAIETKVNYSTLADPTPGAVQATIDSGNPAQTDGDYTEILPANAVTITFAPGETTKTAEVVVTPDANDDAPAETLAVDLSGPNGLAIADGRAIGTITDDDATPTVTVVNAGTVTEPNEPVTTKANPPFHLVLSHTSNRLVTVSYATVDETAANGDDYGAVTGSVSFPVGSRRPSTNKCTLDPATDPDACIDVTVFGDNVSEANETYALHLSSPVNATAGPDGHATINDNDAFPTVSIASAGNVTETNGTTAAASFTVSLSTPSGQTTTVHYATADGTAKQPGDYTSTAGTLTFAAGETEKTVLVPIKGDTSPEPNESFTLTLSSPQQLTLGTATGTATIVNDDGAAPSLAIGNVTVTEGTGGTKNAVFTVTLTGTPGQAVTVDYASDDGTAKQPGDYTPSTGTLTFAAGDTTKTINVPIATDNITEPNETFMVSLTNPNNAVIGTATGTGTITDDDAVPVVSIASTSVVEGDSGTTTANFPVTLNHPSASTVTVSAATTDGTAGAPTDYQAASGPLTFAPGETSKNFSVLVNGDTTPENNETITATLSSPTNATLAGSGGSTATGTITDDDTIPSLSVADQTLAEGTGGTTTAGVVVTLSPASAKTVTVNYGTADGSAVAPGDYTAGTGTLTFAPGDTTKTINVAVNPDTTDEPNEAFAVNLSGASNATIADNAATVSITDDDAAPSASVNDVSVTEGNSGTTNATFTVTLTNPSSQNVTVSYASSDASATAGIDYAAVASNVTIAPGATSATFNVPVVGDTAPEGTETFTVTLSSPVNATIGDGTGTGTITDDDAPAGTLSVADVTVTEGTGGATTATVTVSLSSAAASNVTVDYATSDGTAKAADYSATTGTLTFTPGQTSKTFPVTINPDSLDENDEKLNVTLTNPTNATIGDGAGAVTITDDDATPSIVISDATLTEGNANTKLLSFKVTMSAPSGRTVKVNFATANGAATSGSDYVAKSGTLTFAPGQVTKTINVTINGDTTPEANETLSVKLASPVNVTLADAQAIGTINNDD